MNLLFLSLSELLLTLLMLEKHHWIIWEVAYYLHLREYPNSRKCIVLILYIILAPLLYRLVSSVGRASDSRPEGREFKSLTGQLFVKLRKPFFLYARYRIVKYKLQVPPGLWANCDYYIVSVWVVRRCFLVRALVSSIGSVCLVRVPRSLL